MQNTPSNDKVVFERDESRARPLSPVSVPSGFNPSNVSDDALAVVAESLINDVILDFCFQVHRGSRFGLFRNETPQDDSRSTEDIFGQISNNQLIHCPHCNTKLEASRFASHLEKCMVGNGRQSSRVAKKKLGEMGNGYVDDENESDSSYSSRKKTTKKKSSKSTLRKKVNKDQSILEASLSQPSSVSGSEHSFNALDNCKSFFDKYCGVKSRKTKKPCMNSLKCVLHKDEMRELIRKETYASYEIKPQVDDEHVDVDTVDADGGAFYTAPGMSRSSSPEFNNSD